MFDYKVININDKEYPEKLLNIKDAPQKLYVMGNKKLLNEKSIAIVGSRACTEYGEKYAEKFARELSKSGICVVSGLAIRNRYCST